MTPTAVTPAARTKRSAASPDAAGRSPAAVPTAPANRPRRTSTPKRPGSPHPSTPRPSHRTPLQRSTVPRAPRRVSGPVAGVTTPRPTAPRTTPRRAPRVDTPARVPRSARALARLRTLPDHSLLDRVVRGRLWIPLLGVLLVGIVAMQVEVLKLNASIGHSMVHSTQLQSDNQLLRASVSKLSDDQRVESEAVDLGMSMPAATQPLFVTDSTSANLSRALANIHTPDATAFAAKTAQAAAARAAAVIDSSGQ
jgi:cell division protein FtsL